MGAADGLSPARRILSVSLIFGLHVVNGFTESQWSVSILRIVLVFLPSILDAVIRFETGPTTPHSEGLAGCLHAQR